MFKATLLEHPKETIERILTLSETMTDDIDSEWEK
jgi:hypothetical protein